MELILVRHGQTEDNVNRVTSGQSNGQLTAQGVHQATQLGKRLSPYKFDLVISSDLQRTKDTTAAILGTRSVPVVYDERIREKSVGVFTG